MSFNSRHALLALGTIGLLTISSCSSESSKKRHKHQSPEPGQLNTDGELVPGITPIKDSATKVEVTGQLAVGTSLNLASLPNKVLAFPLMGGALTAHGDYTNVANIKTVSVDKETRVFNVELPRNSETMAQIKACQNSDGSIDTTQMTELGFPSDMVAPIAAMTTAQQKAYWPTFLSKMEGMLAQSYVLVSMVDSSDRFAEAQTFNFIGLTSGKNNLINILPDKALGNISFGRSTVTGDDARGALKATDDVFDMSTDALGQMAYTNFSLKSVKNGYINTDLVADYTYSAQLWFWFNNTAASPLSEPINAWTSPANQTYNGYSVSIQPGGTAAIIDYEPLCDGSPILELAPPSGTTITDGTTTWSDTSEQRMGNRGLTTADTISGSPSGSNTVFSCDFNNSTVHYQTFFTASEPSSSNYTYAIWQYGGSNGLTGEVPAGWWNLYKDDASVAKFDLRTAYPLDSAGKPRVYIPSIKISKQDDGLITGIQLQMYLWDSTTNAFKKITDLSAVNRTVRVGISLQGTFGQGMDNDLPMSSTDDTFSMDEWPPVKDSTTHYWCVSGATNSSCNRTLTSAIVWYEMFGNQYAIGWTNN